MSIDSIKEFYNSALAKLTGQSSLIVTDELLERVIIERIRQLGFQSPAPYLEYIKTNLQEQQIALSQLTNHHTYFFRDSAQFDTIKNELASICTRLKKDNRKTIKIWSAACSFGHEAYSLALFLDYHLRFIDPSMSFEITGTDIDAYSVARAKNGVYSRDELSKVPLPYIDDKLQIGTGDISMYAKIADSIFSKCSFFVFNLLDIPEQSLVAKYDIVLCRNVLIYFDEKASNSIVKNIYQQLHPGGLLCFGLGESLPFLQDIPLRKIAPATYETTASTKVMPLKSVPAHQRILKVFCIDDSRTIQKMLARILTKERGFELVGQAYNGKEAAEKLPSSGAEVVTLDIHMPEMTGIEYLETHFTKSHPPVVIVSSVQRDEATLGFRALELGASDFVQKPHFNKLEQSAEELRSKLYAAVSIKRKSISLHSEKIFAKSLTQIDKNKHAILLCASAGNLDQAISLLQDQEQTASDCPISCILIEGQNDLLPEIVERIQKSITRPVKIAGSNYKPGSVVIGDGSEGLEQIKSILKSKQTCCFIACELSPLLVDGINKFEPDCIFIDESFLHSGLQFPDAEVSTLYSFNYLAGEFWKKASHD